MKNFDWEEFEKYKVGVKCETLSQAKDFVKKSHEKGIEWVTRCGADKTRFNLTNNEIYYFCNMGDLTYGGVSSAKEAVKIIDWNIQEGEREMKKELTILEVMEMPLDTHFKATTPSNYKYKCKLIKSQDNKILYNLDKKRNVTTLNDYVIKTKFELIDKEVTFKEAVEHFYYKGKIKCILPYNESIYDGAVENDFIDEEGQAMIADEILNGTWYIIN